MRYPNPEHTASLIGRLRRRVTVMTPSPGRDLYAEAADAIEAMVPPALVKPEQQTPAKPQRWNGLPENPETSADHWVAGFRLHWNALARMWVDPRMGIGCGPEDIGGPYGGPVIRPAPVDLPPPDAAAVQQALMGLIDAIGVVPAGAPVPGVRRVKIAAHHVRTILAGIGGEVEPEQASNPLVSA